MKKSIKQKTKDTAKNDVKVTVTGKSKLGRPDDYSEELAKLICDTIASCSKGIKTLCKENPKWPSYNTIYRWLPIHAEFSDLYARAKQQQIEVLVEEILEIADDSSNDYIENSEGKLIVNHEHINRCRLRIDTRKWLAAKLCPRIYGDKMVTESTVTITHENALKELE